MLRALIFDVDGTLAETEEIHRQAFNTAFQEYKIDWNWTEELYSRLLAVAGGKDRILHYARQINADFIDQANAETYVERIQATKTALYIKLLGETKLPPRVGVLRLLEEARSQNLRLAIATSATVSNVEALLDNILPAGWRCWFEVIITRDIVTDKKPSPAVYQTVLERMGLTPGECLAFEDTPIGNAAALTAGIKTVITTHGFTQKEGFRGASLVVDSLGEPGQPFRVLAGNSHNAGYLDLSLARKILEEKVLRMPRPDRRPQPAPLPASLATSSY
jgi:HAD superfamily hydrolase (TIGR01509 family)